MLSSCRLHLNGVIEIFKRQLRHGPESDQYLVDDDGVMPVTRSEGSIQMNIDAQTMTLLSQQASLILGQDFGHEPISEVSYDVKIKFLSRELIDPKELTEIFMSESWQSAQDTQQMQDIKMLRETVGDSTSDNLMAELEAITWTKDDGLTNEVYLKIKALLELDKQSVQEFFTKIKDLPHDHPFFELIVDLLGTVGTVACQEALINLIDHRFEDEGALYAIPSLSLLAKPSEIVEQTLMESLVYDPRSELRSISVLALGKVGMSVKKDRRHTHEEIYRFLTKQLVESQNNEQRSLYLTALGNLGHENQVEVAQPFLARNQPKELRIDAIRSLRFQMGEATSDLLLSIARDEKDPKIVNQAIYALRFRKLSEAFLLNVYQVYRQQSDRHIKQQILSIFLNHRDFPAIAEHLQRIRDEDPLKEIRDMLQMAL
ncbi:MAG: HEAT repeat domain-containing protein [Oligoflexus sp.]